MPKIPFWIFIIIAIIYFTSVRVDTMDIDASQYASISREMLHSHNWLQVYDQGRDYLDKPPFLFWASAASMKIFGEGNFGYKFPSILFALLAIFATYRLAKLLYSENTARAAALILATCQGMFLMVNDIRCDTILMSWVITSIWLIKEWDASRKFVYLLLGFVSIGFGMMTKGPIALMVPVFCFAADWALKREWKKFFHPGYLLGILIIAIILLPMSIGLYQQFDLHPEKIVNGKVCVSGLRFFYWSQSFGRITGESPWKNDVDLSFLLSNMLWSFLPWIFVFIPAFIVNIIGLIRQKLKLQPGQEWLSTGGFLLSYLALGSSAYQLPHYIFVAFPLAAIVTASFIATFLESGKQVVLFKILKPILLGITGLVIGIVLILIVLVFPSGMAACLLWMATAGIWIYLLISKRIKGKIILVTAAGMIIANLFLANFVYPSLLNYQLGSQVGRYIKDKNIQSSDFLFYKVNDPLNSLAFYSGQVLFGGDTIIDIKQQKYILTMDEGKKDLETLGYKFSVLKQGTCFKVSELTPEFLNPATRNKAVRAYYLLAKTNR